MFWRKRYHRWKYMGYKKEQLKPYEDSIAMDNLKVLQWMLLATVGILLLLMVLLNHAMIISPQTADQIAGITPVLVSSLVWIVLLNILVLKLKKGTKKVLVSKVFTVIYLSIVNFLFFYTLRDFRTEKTKKIP